MCLSDELMYYNIIPNINWVLICENVLIVASDL